MEHKPDNFDKEFSLNNNKKNNKKPQRRIPSWLMILAGAAVIGGVVAARQPFVRPTETGTMSSVSIQATQPVPADLTVYSGMNDQQVDSSELEARFLSKDGQEFQYIIPAKAEGNAQGFEMDMEPLELDENGFIILPEEKNRDASIYWVNGKPYALRLLPQEKVQSDQPAESPASSYYWLDDRAYEVQIQPVDESKITSLTDAEKGNLVRAGEQTYLLNLIPADPTAARAEQTTPVPEQSAKVQSTDIVETAESTVEKPDATADAAVTESADSDKDTSEKDTEAEAPAIVWLNDKAYSVTVKPYNGPEISDETESETVLEVEPEEDEEPEIIRNPGSESTSEPEIQNEPVIVLENQTMTETESVSEPAQELEQQTVSSESEVVSEPADEQEAQTEAAGTTIVSEPTEEQEVPTETTETVVPTDIADVQEIQTESTDVVVSSDLTDDTETLVTSEPVTEQNVEVDAEAEVEIEAKPETDAVSAENTAQPVQTDATAPDNHESDETAVVPTVEGEEPTAVPTVIMTTENTETTEGSTESSPDPQSDPQLTIFTVDGKQYALQLEEIAPEDVPEGTNGQAVIWVDETPLQVMLHTEEKPEKVDETVPSQDEAAEAPITVELNPLSSDETAALQRQRFGEDFPTATATAIPQPTETPVPTATPTAQPEESNWFRDMFNNIFGSTPTQEPTPGVTIIPLTPTPTLVPPTATPIIVRVVPTTIAADPVIPTENSISKDGDLDDPALWDIDDEPTAVPGDTEAGHTKPEEESTDVVPTATEQAELITTETTEEPTAQPSPTPAELPHTGMADGWNIPSMLGLLAGLLLIIIGVRRLRVKN